MLYSRPDHFDSTGSTSQMGLPGNNEPLVPAMHGGVLGGAQDGARGVRLCAGGSSARGAGANAGSRTTSGGSACSPLTHLSLVCNYQITDAGAGVFLCGGMPVTPPRGVEMFRYDIRTQLPHAQYKLWQLSCTVPTAFTRCASQRVEYVLCMGRTKDQGVRSPCKCGPLFPGRGSYQGGTFITNAPGAFVNRLSCAVPSIKGKLVEEAGPDRSAAWCGWQVFD
eukprot:1159343-Pelagomonas_calceolata.AAC.1